MKNIDYRSFEPGGKKDEGNFDKRWWLLGTDELPEAVSRIVGFIAKNDTKRESQYQTNVRLYGNAMMGGFQGLSYSKYSQAQANQTGMKERITYNVVQSAVDTVVAKLAKNKPKPMFLTSGGDYKMKRKAQKLQKFTDGIFYENKAHILGRTILRDALVLGDGLVHVFEHAGRVKYERVLPQELFVDWVEAYYGEPRQMHRVKNIDRQLLIELFPKYKKDILLCDSASAALVGQFQNVADQVTVVESWHLPSGPEALDGLHTITISNKTLLIEDYTKAFFPFAKLTWADRQFGFWGQGAPEQIQSIQLEMNKLLWVIQRSMHLAGSFKVFIENGSKIVKEHLNNDIGAIVNYNGTPPQYVVPPVVPLEYYQHFQNLKAMAYEQLGVSQLSAASKKPDGLNSGKALREFNDIESDRFQVIGQAYEEFFLQLAHLTISVAKDIYARDKRYEVTVPGKKFIETINWKEIDLEEDEYVMQMFPVSSLPNEPAGRLQTVQEYVQAGFISPRAARRLLDFPDLEQIDQLQDATEDYLHMILEKIVDGDGSPDTYTPPEPFDDLALAHELGLEYYEQGKLGNLEPEKLELLRQFIDQVELLKQKAMQPPPGAPGAAQPQANPMPAPQSDMVPNVPMPMGA